MRVALMIEGQEGVTWDDWVALARACEQGGFDALFRSDHYVGLLGDEDRDALDAWGTITALAATTTTLRLGTLVSPVTYRHPSVLAKLVATADQISGGRVELGMGAGWNEREHAAYGFPFPGTHERLSLLAEQVEIVRRQLTQSEVSFTGRHYRLDALQPQPAPVQSPVPLIVGGGAGPRSAALAARWADEYNTFGAARHELTRRRDALARAWQAAGRDGDGLRFSIMARSVVATAHHELLRRVAAVMQRSGADGDPAALLADQRERWIAGTPDEVAAQLHELEAAGVTRVMLQHIDHRDLDMVDLIAAEIIPAVA